jgi:hypothetical protein
MGTLKQEFIYFNDSVGRVIPNASLEFYEAGTTTLKDTYTEKTLTNKNPWPLVSDGAGRFSVIWLGSGGYKLKVKDKDGVLIEERDDIGLSESGIDTTAAIYFATLADAKLGVAINGDSINLTVDQVVRTQGKVTSTDGSGAEWVVVAAATGTADDDLYADLANGLQIKKLFNQLYTDRNLAEIALAGTVAQAEARENLGLTLRGAIVYRTTSQSIPTVTPTAIILDNEDYDTSNFHDNVTNNTRLTIPAGVSHVVFSGQVDFASNSSGSRLVAVRKNGTESFAPGHPVVKSDPGDGTTYDMSIAVTSGALSVTEGDYFELVTTQTSGVNLNVGNVSKQVWFSVLVID